MTVDRVSVSSDVLTWARAAIGLSASEAARRIGISENVLSKWEQSALSPTIKQLRKTAKTYKLPLAVLLVEEPPIEFEPIRDYRRAPDGHTLVVSPELHAEVRRARMQREVLLEISEFAPGILSESVEIPDISVSTPVEDAAQELRSFIGLTMATQLAWRDRFDALNFVVDAVERNGLLVIHAARVPTAEARGFSISESPYPVIGLNGADLPRPRLFTLMHELTHIALNLGGVCDLHEVRTQLSVDDEVEHFCNQVAAAVLVPADDLLRLPTVAGAGPESPWPLDQLQQVADRYSISSEALLLRLLSLNKASWDTYWTRKEELEEIYATLADEKKQRQAEASGGPSYYVVKARDIGHGYAHAVLEAYRSRAISSLDVSDYLQVKYNQIPRLEQVLR